METTDQIGTVANRKPVLRNIKEYDIGCYTTEQIISTANFSQHIKSVQAE